MSNRVCSSRECWCFCYSVSEYLCTANIDSRSTSTATAGLPCFYTVSSDIGMHCTIPRISCMQSQPLNLFPAAWTVASKDPSLVLCKFQFHVVVQQLALTELLCFYRSEVELVIESPEYNYSFWCLQHARSSSYPCKFMCKVEICSRCRLRISMDSGADGTR